jgi:hypothetical protein
MPHEQTRTGLWLAMWTYMVITLVVPLAFGVSGILDWGIAMGVAAAFWTILFVGMAIVQEWRPARTKRRTRREKLPDAEAEE